MNNNKVLFSKNWYKKGLENKYYVSILPGYIKGISGSTINGYNIGVNKFINKENKIAAAKVIMYFTSEINQMYYAENYGNISGMQNIYDNQTFCKTNQDICNIYTNSQPITRPYTTLDNYKDYSMKVRNYITQFLYNSTDDTYDAKSTQTLGMIEDITKIYYIEKSSTLGKFSIWGTTATIILIIMTYTSIYNLKYGAKFIFLPKSYWLAYTLGVCLMIGYLYTNIGEMTLLKCQVKTVLFTVGFTLTTTVQCLKLISIYPNKTNFTVFTKKFFSIIVSISVWMDVFVCTLFIGVSYKNITIYNAEGINFQKCQFQSPSSIILLIIILLYKVFVLIAECILISIEWNDIYLKHDIRMLVFSQVLTFAFIITYIIILLINFNDLNKHYLIRNITVYVYCVLNFILNFVYKLLTPSKYYEVNNINIKKYAVFNRVIDKNEKSNDIMEQNEKYAEKY